MYQDKLDLNLISQIYDGKSVIIPQSLHDLIINYFIKNLSQLEKYKIGQKYILISEIIRFAQNGPSFINNLEKSTKVKVYDKTTNQTIDMIVSSLMNNLEKQKSSQILIKDNLSFFNLTKRKILLKIINQEPNDGRPDYLLENFSSISLEKFIKKDIFHWTTLSNKKSVNPIGNIKINKLLDTYVRYLDNKIPQQFKKTKIIGTDISENTTTKKYVNYQNKQEKEKNKTKQDTLIITGDTILESLNTLKTRGNWIRRDALKTKIMQFANYQDGKIPSKDPRYAIINLILLYGHMSVMGYEKAYMQASNFEEGFLLHPEFY